MSTLPTPRTDALIQWLNNDAKYKAPEQLAEVFEMHMQKVCDLSAQLERELTEAKAERDALKAALADSDSIRHGEKRILLNEIAQHTAARADLSRWRALAEELAGALEKINKDIPACDQNGQLYVLHFDGEGNELGQEFVDPVALCGHLSARIEEALTRFRDAANPASGAAITPVIHRTE